MIPWATAIPWKSSGEVSTRTRTTFSPRAAQATASSASKTARPTAAPGDAFRPLTIVRGGGPGLRVELVAQELVHLGRLDPADRLGLRDDPFLDHVDGDLHGGRGRPLRGARLEHVELAALDRELEVLDVAVVALQALADPLELGVGPGHLVGQVGDLRRRPDAGHDVLALGVDEVLAEEDALARVRVAGEGDAGAGIVAHVAEDHRHDVDGRAQVVGDLLVLAVVAGALAEPGLAKTALIARSSCSSGSSGKSRPVGLADDRLELGDELAEVSRRRGPCPGARRGRASWPRGRGRTAHPERRGRSGRTSG